MKLFKSFLAPLLCEYLIHRENLGYETKSTLSYLKTFDRYVREKRIKEGLLQPSFFLVLRSDLKIESRSVNTALSNVRMFFEFLVRRGIYEHNPLQDIPPLPEAYFVPFVFSPEQIDQLLAAACKRLRKTEHSYLKDLSQYMAILLMARCGLRISEPIRLLRNHYRQEEKTLYIEKTKFKKDRLIPVPMSAATAIENYLAVRDLLVHKDQSPYLLVGFNHGKLNHNTIRLVFHKAVNDIGLNKNKQTVGNINFGAPVPHSLRHAFAINTLKQIKDRGGSRHHALPVLAIYMGHRKYQFTTAYLKVSDAKDVTGLIEFAKSQKYGK